MSDDASNPGQKETPEQTMLRVDAEATATTVLVIQIIQILIANDMIDMSATRSSGMALIRETFGDNPEYLHEVLSSYTDIAAKAEGTAYVPAADALRRN